MSYKRNIPLIYLTGSLGWSRFFIPVLALFYVASKVPLEQFSIILAVYSIIILLLEVPSGVVADLLGKKKTILLGRAFFVVELFIFAFYDGFWPLLIAKVLCGFGVSLLSGAEDALLFDTLKRLDRVPEHKKISGTYFMFQHFTTAVTFMLGGFLFALDYKLPAKLALIFSAASFMITTFIREPYAPPKKISFANSLLHLKEGIQYFRNHDYVKYIVLFSLPVMTAVVVTQSFSSAYFAEIMIPVTMIGVIAFFTSTISATTARKSQWIEEKLGEKHSLLLIQLVLAGAVMLMSLMLEISGLWFYLPIAFVWGFTTVVLNHYMNLHIETPHRATLLSIKNMANNIGIAIMMPVFGYMIKWKTMQASFWVLGAVFVAYALVLYIYSRRLKIRQIE